MVKYVNLNIKILETYIQMRHTKYQVRFYAKRVLKNTKALLYERSTLTKARLRKVSYFKCVYGMHGDFLVFKNIC